MLTSTEIQSFIADSTLIRYEVDETESTVVFYLVNYAIDKDEKADDDSEECELMNGHLFKLIFSGITSFKCNDVVADSYVQRALSIGDHSLEATFSTYDYVDDEDKEKNSASELSISFSFEETAIEDLDEIKSPDA